MARKRAPSRTVVCQKQLELWPAEEFLEQEKCIRSQCIQSPGYRHRVLCTAREKFLAVIFNPGDPANDNEEEIQELHKRYMDETEDT